MVKRRFTPTVAYSAININDPTGPTGYGPAAVGQPLASRLYVQSRGENLISNGSGLLGNNYNFSTLTFDPTETYSGGGSFRLNVATAARFSDELIPIDPSKQYKLSGWAKSGEIGGTNYSATNRQYLGLSLYDADGLQVSPYMVIRYVGSTDTTLAVALNPGDTTMTLTNATGWYNGASSTARNFAWWPYTNALGYSYPNYTYTRNTSIPLSTYYSLGVWSAAGISGNVITLRIPWAGPALPIGAPVRNNDDGGTYKYVATANTIVPNAWTSYSGFIGATDTAGILDPAKFSHGTAYVKLLFLINYHGAADNNIRWSNLWFGESDTAVNLAAEITRATAAEGAVAATASTLTARFNAPAPDVQTFTASGTWTKPTGNYTTAYIYTVGAGSGGASGRRGAAGTVRCGGGGGGGGPVSFQTIPISLLGATETVTVATGGAGALGQTVDDNNGISSTSPGTTTSFGAWVRCATATFATGGTNAAGLGAAVQTVGMIPGGGGGAAGTTGLTSFISPQHPGAAGGGAGGGITTADVAAAGGTGGAPGGNTRVGGVGGTAPGGAGVAGTGSTGGDPRVGVGGGGGAASTVAAGGAGGAGSYPGGGGGGGGASLNGFASGAGGAGANGFVQVVCR